LKASPSAFACQAGQQQRFWADQKGGFGSQYPRSMWKKQNQLDQRGNTFWGPIELVRKPYSVVDSSSTDFFRHFR
jgi:hypothetical protein